MKRLFILLFATFVSCNLTSITYNHIIEDGDTLINLAEKYGTTIHKISEENNLKNQNIIKGKILKITIGDPDKYIVKPGDSLSGIALKNNITLKHLLLVNRINKDYILKIDEELTIPTTPELKKEYKVQAGDTLSWISMTYNIEVKDIIKINNLKSEKLKIGQTIKLTTRNSIKTRTAAIKLNTPVKRTNDFLTREYTVVKGDTLIGIASKSNASVVEIKNINNLKGDTLNIGQKIKIPKKEIDYTVKKGDTLLDIAIKNDSTLSEIKSINNLKNDKIRIGQKIKLLDNSFMKSGEELIDDNATIYEIKSGDTLSAIAFEYQTTIDDIKECNPGLSDLIKLGDSIILPSYAKKREPIDYNIYHTVVKGDTLSEISLTYDISETLLKELNNLNSDKIKIGQKIKLIPQQSRTHLIKKGETLWSIAKKYNVSVDQLIQYNHLNSTVAQTGKILNIYDYRVANHLIANENIKVEHKQNPNKYNLVSLRYKHDSNLSQPYKGYSIGELTNPFKKYNLAKDKWKEFTKAINAEKPISDDLKGVTVILDPGHGGKDPGAIAAVQSGDEKLYIVEDEYAYDTTVRLYELLKRNGADVYMTILSPDHVARNPKINTTTFINEKNEIYNNYELNKVNTKRVWPVGGQWGLDQRVEIANNILSSNNNNKTIFISIHADNDKDRGKGKLILYDERSGGLDRKSKNFADFLIKNMGSNAITKGMSLAVFKNNKADLKVLVELRNMAHLSEAVALLDSNNRQKDAQMILDGIKNYISLEY